MKAKTSEEWFELGKMHSTNKNFRDAIYCYKQAVKHDPNFYYAWTNMAAEYFRVHDYKNAIISCEHAIYLQSDDPLAWSTMGASYFQIDEDGKALFCFNKAIELGNDEVQQFLEKARAKKDRIILAKEEDVLALMEKKRKTPEWEDFISYSKIKQLKEVEQRKLQKLIKKTKEEEERAKASRKEIIERLSGLILQLLEKIEPETGGTISVSEFISKFQTRYPKEKAKIDDILTALDSLAKKKLILGVKELGSGIKIIESKPSEFTPDIEKVLKLFHDAPSLNLKELMEATDWDVIRCTRVLNSLENSKLAKKVSKFSEGERWYFLLKNE